MTIIKEKTVDDTKFQAFSEVYTKELQKAVRQHPDDYLYGSANVLEVAGRILKAIADSPPNNALYNATGRALKATCKHFGIQMSHRHIWSFIHGQVAGA